MKGDFRKFSKCMALAATLTLVLSVSAGAQEIPWEFQPTLPEFIGHAAWPHPLPPPQVPQNPYLATSPFSNYHNDTWMSDTYAIPGPLGRKPTVLTSTLSVARGSSTQPAFMCGALLFDRNGRIVTVCNNYDETVIVLVDPVTLDVLAHKQIGKISGEETGLSTAYLILDNRNRAWVPSEDHILVVEQTGGPQNTSFNIAKDYDLSGVIRGIVPAGDFIGAVTPDFSGRIWFVTRNTGIVGIFDPATDTADPVVQTHQLHEEIGNGFAINENDAYIVSTQKMYRFTAGKDNVPHIVWSSKYENVGYQKDGQYSAGSGTTPTILDHGRYVAIGDNAKQFHVVVYRTEANLPPEKRVLCQVPVFEYGYGGCEDSLIGFGRSIVVSNNYGYTFVHPSNSDPDSFISTPSWPGVARIDIAPNEKSCNLVWTNSEITPASYGAKLSTKTGLVYIFSRKSDPSITAPHISHDVWYWSAIDFRTGATVYEQLVGTGRWFDGYWPLGFLGPDGTGYMATWAGIVAIRDAH